MERANARKRKPAARETPAIESDPAFDEWLDHRLKAMYESALHEPIPEDMLRLLREDRPKR